MTYYLPPLDLFDTMQKLLYYASYMTLKSKNMKILLNEEMISLFKNNKDVKN